MALLTYRFGQFTIHGSQDHSNLLGVLAFVAAIPAAIITRWIEGWSQIDAEWLFWILFVAPYFALCYFVWKRFFKWLEPQDIVREPPEQKP